MGMAFRTEGRQWRGIGACCDAAELERTMHGLVSRRAILLIPTGPFGKPPPVAACSRCGSMRRWVKRSSVEMRPLTSETCT
jgi:hypothetical protein